MNRLQAIIGTAFLSAALVPVTAFAGTATTGSFDLATRQTDSDAGGEYDGRLRIKISDDGIVAGTFMDTEGMISTVAGGIDDTKIWIDLRAASPGTSGIYNGTFSAGKLVATRFHGTHTLTLEGSPAAH
jgi:hypothetical protein